MIRSMTAYGRAAAPHRLGGWAAEIRSLNHRYFEFSLKLPPALIPLEDRVRELVQSQIPRGKVTVSVSQELKKAPAGNSPVSVDPAAVQMYLAAIRTLKKRFRLEGDLSLNQFVQLPGVLTAERPEEKAEKVWPALKKVLLQALRKTVQAKQREGRGLARDLLARLGAMEKAVRRIETLGRGRSELVFRKLAEKVDGLLAEKEKDPDRLHREVAFLAERSDITEEMVRFKSHLGLFRRSLEKNGEAGRELDFICQEMNREANTIASKAQLFEISREVIFVKGEIEKIREQVQNIE